jgi:hypothetical protein
MGIKKLNFKHIITKLRKITAVIINKIYVTQINIIDRAHKQVFTLSDFKFTGYKLLDFKIL